MNKKNTRKYGTPRHVIYGICADARAIGVSREYLWRVLVGQKKAPHIIEKYEALKAEQADSGSAQ